MSYSNQQRRLAQRPASVIIPALVVILLVGMLSMQVIQTLALVRRGDDDRAKIMQMRELSEYARGIDWNATESQSFTVQIPDAVLTESEPETQPAILERQSVADNSETGNSTARIVVRFPADKPGEINTTWEINDE
jgi:hypothetical protein